MPEIEKQQLRYFNDTLAANAPDMSVLEERKEELKERLRKEEIFHDQKIQWDALHYQYVGLPKKDIEKMIEGELPLLDLLKLESLLVMQYKILYTEEEIMKKQEKLKELLETLYREGNVHPYIQLDVELLIRTAHYKNLIEHIQFTEQFYRDYPQNENKSLVAMIQPLSECTTDVINNALPYLENLCNVGTKQNLLSPYAKLTLLQIKKLCYYQIGNVSSAMETLYEQYQTVNIQLKDSRSFTKRYDYIIRNVIKNYYLEHASILELDEQEEKQFLIDMDIVVESHKREDPEALYLFGTYYLIKNKLEDAHRVLQRAIECYHQKTDNYYSSQLKSTEVPLCMIFSTLSEVLYRMDKKEESRMCMVNALYHGPLYHPNLYVRLAKLSDSPKMAFEYVIQGLIEFPKNGPLEATANSIINDNPDLFETMTIERGLNIAREQDTMVEGALVSMSSGDHDIGLSILQDLQKEPLIFHSQDKLICFKLALLNTMTKPSKELFDLEELKFLVSHFHHDPEVLLQVARAFMHIGEIDKSFDIIMDIREMVSEIHYVRSMVNRFYLASGEKSSLNKGLNDLNAILKKYPNCTHALYNRSLFYATMGVYDRAFRDLSTCVFYSGSADFAIAAAHMAAECNLPDQEAIWAKFATRLAPDDYHGYIILARYYTKYEPNSSSAIDNIKKALALNPTLPNLYQDLANIYSLVDQDPTRAIEILSQTLSSHSASLTASERVDFLSHIQQLKKKETK